MDKLRQLQESHNHTDEDLLNTYEKRFNDVTQKEDTEGLLNTIEERFQDVK